MKTKFVLILLLLATPVAAQEVIESDGSFLVPTNPATPPEVADTSGPFSIPETSEATPAPVPAPAAEPAEEASHATRTLEMVKETIKNSEDIGPLKKLILLRRLKRPAVANRVTDLVTSEALDDGTIVFDGDGYAVDWDQLLELIKELLPIILKLLSLFG